MWPRIGAAQPYACMFVLVVGVGDEEQVREEDEQHPHAADAVAAEQRADPDVGPAVRRSRGIAHPRRVVAGTT